MMPLDRATTSSYRLSICSIIHAQRFGRNFNVRLKFQTISCRIAETVGHPQRQLGFFLLINRWLKPTSAYFIVVTSPTSEVGVAFVYIIARDSRGGINHISLGTSSVRQNTRNVCSLLNIIQVLISVAQPQLLVD